MGAVEVVEAMDLPGAGSYSTLGQLGQPQLVYEPGEWTVYIVRSADPLHRLDLLYGAVERPHGAWIGLRPPPEDEPIRSLGKARRLAAQLAAVVGGLPRVGEWEG